MASRFAKGSVAATAMIAMLAGFEGYSSKAYPDIVGVYTICYGETKNVHPGMVMTRPECDTQLLKSIQEHESGMRGCLRTPDAIPINVYISEVSLTYNIGIGGFCKSTVAKLTNEIDYRGACRSFMMWNKAGGRVVAGLTDRRRKEMNFCLSGAS